MSVNTYKKVTVVDENDIVIGAEYLADAKKKGLLRRAARVFVFDENGRMLIQRRSSTVFNPLQLDQSVGGHVDEGESYFEAAKRELKEELNLECELEEIILSYRNGSFFNGIFRTVITASTEIKFNSDEVAEVIWFSIPELETHLQTRSDEFTRGFVELWPQFRDKIIPV